MSTTPTSSSQGQNNKFQKGLFSQLSQSALSSKQVISSIQQKPKHATMQRDISPRQLGSSKSQFLNSGHSSVTPGATGQGGAKRSIEGHVNRDLNSNAQQSRLSKTPRQDSQAHSTSQTRRTTANGITAQPRIDTGLRQGNRTPRLTQNQTEKSGLIGTQEDHRQGRRPSQVKSSQVRNVVGEMPMTTCTSKQTIKTVKQDETMLSQEHNPVQPHYKNKLSIDERLAAHQEAKKAVQSQQMLFTEEQTTQVMTGDHTEVDAASFPHFILQSLQDGSTINEPQTVQQSLAISPPIKTNPNSRGQDGSSSQQTLLLFNSDFSQKSMTHPEDHFVESKEVEQDQEDTRKKWGRQTKATVESANQRLYYNRVQDRSVSNHSVSNGATTISHTQGKENTAMQNRRGSTNLAERKHVNKNYDLPLQQRDKIQKRQAKWPEREKSPMATSQPQQTFEQVENETQAADELQVQHQQTTTLTNASNQAILQNLRRIEENYKTYARSHIEIAKVKIETQSIKAQLQSTQKELDLVQKSQTSLVGFLQDLRERMLKGASLQEMQRMIGRKLVVHAKYADQVSLQDYQQHQTNEDGESRSASKSKSRSHDRQTKTTTGKRSQTINLQNLHQKVSSNQENSINIELDGANYSTKDQVMDMHPLRQFEQQAQSKTNVDFPHTEMTKQSYSQLPVAKPPKLSDLPRSGNDIAHIQSHRQLTQGSQEIFLTKKGEPIQTHKLNHQHMLSQQNLHSSSVNDPNHAIQLHPLHTVGASTISDVYEYTLSKAYSSGESSPKQGAPDQARQPQQTHFAKPVAESQDQHHPATIMQIPHVQHSMPTQSSIDTRVNRGRQQELAQTMDLRQIDLIEYAKQDGNFSRLQTLDERRQELERLQTRAGLMMEGEANGEQRHQVYMRPSGASTQRSRGLLRDSQTEDMLSPPSELQMTSNRPDKDRQNESSSMLRDELNQLGAQMVTNQSQNMFSHNRKIEIAVALQSFTPGVDLQMDEHDPDEFLSFRAGEKILIENRQVQHQDDETSQGSMIEVEWAFGSIGGQRKGWFPIKPFTRIEEHKI